MPNHKLRLIALMSICGLVFISGIQSAQAAETKISVSGFAPELVIGDPSTPLSTLMIEARAESPRDMQIVVEFVDFYTSEEGQPVELPGGSTPYSLANVLEVREFDDVYRGKGQQQTFEIHLDAKTEKISSLYQGGISVSMVPVGTDQSTSGASRSGGIVRTLTVTPYGLAATLAEGDLVAAAITRHDLRAIERSSFIDSILPDLPGVINYGPVESRVTYENKGTYPVFTKMKWDFSSGGEGIATRSVPPALMVPGESKTQQVTTQSEVERSEVLVNVLPGFGFVSNKITLTSSLGGTELPVQVYDGSFLVLQWKEPLVGIVGLYFLVRWAWRKNLSPRQRQETATLIGLGIQSAWKGLNRRLRGASSNAPEPVASIAAPAPKAIEAKPTEPKPMEPRPMDPRPMDPRPMYIPPSASYTPSQYPTRKP